MRLLRHAPLTAWVITVAALIAATVLALSVDAQGQNIHPSAPTAADRAVVHQIRLRLPVLSRLARTDDPGLAAWSADTAAVARDAAADRAERTGHDDLVTAYENFAAAADQVDGSGDDVPAVARVLDAADALTAASFGYPATDLPPVGDGLQRPSPDTSVFTDRPSLPDDPDPAQPDRPTAPRVPKPPLDRPGTPALRGAGYPPVDRSRVTTPEPTPWWEEPTHDILGASQ